MKGLLSKMKFKINYKEKQEQILKLEKENAELLEKLEKTEQFAENMVIHNLNTDRICCDLSRINSKDHYMLSLIESIKKYGVIEPVIVRRISVETSPEEGLFSLISGARRITALRILGIERVPALIVDNCTEDSVLSFILNNNSLNYGIFEQSDMIITYLQNHSDNLQALMSDFCITKEKIAELLQISSIPAEQREMCLHYNLTDKQIKCIAAIADDKQRRFAIRHIGSSHMSLRQTVEYLYDIHSIDCLAENELPTKTKMIIKDMRLFYNTIDRAIDTFSESGVRAECHKKETSDGFLITIRISKTISAE